MRQRFVHTLLTLAMFFLPWQTQAILSAVTIGGEATPYGTLGIYVVEVMILLAFAMRGKPQVAPSMRPIVKALLLFLAAAFFSLTVSRIDAVGWFHVLHLLSAAALFLLLIDERTRLTPVLVAFLAGLLMPMAIGWQQVLTGSSGDSTLLGIAAKDAATPGVSVVETIGGRTMRAYGTFPHPNIFGGYLAIGLLILAWLTRLVRSRPDTALCLLANVALASTLVITFSRSAWLALVLALLTIASVLLVRRRVPARRTLVVTAVGFLVALATLGVFREQAFSRFDPTQRLEAISLTERTSQYQTFGSVFLSSPILGVGPGAYPFSLSLRDPGHPAWDYQPIHNTPLLLLAELGVIGFLLFGNWLYRIGKPSNGLWVALVTIALLDHYLLSLWSGLALAAIALALVAREPYNANRDPCKSRGVVE